MPDEKSKKNPFLEAALRYAAQGLAIFPCKPRKKAPAIMDNLNSATCSEEQIRAWWTKWPKANIALVTGTKNGRFVVDPDGPLGETSLEKLIAEHGALPETFEVRTGRADGGRHLHFRVQGVTTKSAASLLGPNLDVKGDGGFVLLPPSIHPDTGREYTVIHNGAPAEAPAWLLKLVSDEGEKKKRVQPSGENKIPYGKHYTELLSIAGKLRNDGLEEDVLAAALVEICEKRCENYGGDYRDMCQSIARQVTKYYPPADIREQTPFKRDVANAALFAQMHEGCLLYCADRGVWYAWDGKRFAENDLGEVMRRARATVRRRYEEALAEVDDEQRKKRMTWALQSEARLEKMVDYASSETRLEVKKFNETFDLDPYLLNCANGILDLRTGELRPHDPAARMTLLTRVPYDPEATCPKFIQWLLDTCGGSVSLKDYLVRFIGYCLSGLTDEQAFWMLYGPSKTGKSTFIKILRHLLDEYATTLPEAAVVVTYHGNPEHALAQLANVRLATLVEIEKGKRYDEAKLKQITGQDWIGASKKYQNFFEFRSKAKLAIAVNQRLIVRETDDAFWNRCKPVPFLAVVPPEKRIKDLDIILIQEEGPGILNLAARGFRERCANGMSEPPEVQAASAEYRRHEDLVFQFIEEECVKDAKAKEATGELFAAFIRWKENNGVHTTWTKTLFGKELERLGYTSKKSGIHYWTGLRLIARVGDL